MTFRLSNTNVFCPNHYSAFILPVLLKCWCHHTNSDITSMLWIPFKDNTQTARTQDKTFQPLVCVYIFILWFLTWLNSHFHFRKKNNVSPKQWTKLNYSCESPRHCDGKQNAKLEAIDPNETRIGKMSHLRTKKSRSKQTDTLHKQQKCWKWWVSEWKAIVFILKGCILGAMNEYKIQTASRIYLVTVGAASKTSLEGSRKVSAFHCTSFNWIHSPLLLRFIPPLSPLSLSIMQTHSLISVSGKVALSQNRRETGEQTQ